MLVELTKAEAFQAAQGGLLRNFNAISKGFKNNHGHNSPGWDVHIDGAMAELAVAKYLGKFWCANLETNDNDVAGIQIRSTRHVKGCLILHPQDKEADYFLVIVLPDFKFKIAGWIDDESGKQKRFFKDPGTGRPAYFVPQTALFSLNRFRA